MMEESYITPPENPAQTCGNPPAPQGDFICEGWWLVAVGKIILG
jgi:hypothetical protein